ncbi:MAG: hypothetical protein A3H69_01455 [Candidatus Sungbacteria bacterium RIFCSPLOWO2_02_FULL_47_9]|nr:MAG: hypothetical protein A3H69_01455 [Candidatus Sungbacteria bacterium RIFCSPLOWO2_02_FULL_47_9]
MKRSLITTILLIMLVGGFAVYYFYFAAAPATEDQGPEFSVLTPEEQTKLEEYRQIKNISFDQGLLNDPFFKELRDVDIPPPPSEPLGRPDPFLPFEQKQTQTQSPSSGKIPLPAPKPK